MYCFTPKHTNVCFQQVEDLQVGQDDATCGEAASEDAESATDRRESVSESEVLTLASVDFESASRLEYDRSRRSKVNLDDVVDGQKADQEFMRALVSMLRKVHCRSSTIPAEHAVSRAAWGGLTQHAPIGRHILCTSASEMRRWHAA